MSGFLTVNNYCKYLFSYICSMKTNKDFKALRARKGFTQKKLAQIVGTTQTTITNIENGITKYPSVDIALKIADALGEDVYMLFADESIKNFWSNIEIEKDKLKILAFRALDMFYSNQIFFKYTEFEENNPEHQKKFEEYRNHLKEFKTGMYKALVAVGFCTHEDIKKYREYINPNKKK